MVCRKVWCNHCQDYCDTVRDPDKFYICCTGCGRVIEQDIYADVPIFIKDNSGQTDQEKVKKQAEKPQMNNPNVKGNTETKSVMAPDAHAARNGGEANALEDETEQDIDYDPDYDYEEDEDGNYAYDDFEFEDA